MRTTSFCLAALIFGLTTGSGIAQEISGCSLRETDDPPLRVYTCENGLVIEAEEDAEFQPVRPDLKTAPEGLQLEDSALFIELEPGHGPFQIMTPYAIASVRGTIFVVDAQDEVTSVFVVRGAVSVARANGSQPVELTAGDGVDVSEDEDLVVRQWPADRVGDLLERFDR